MLWLKPLMFFLITFIVNGMEQEKLLYEPNAPDYRITSDSPFSSNRQSLFDRLAPDAALSTFMDVLTQVDDIFRLFNATTSQNTFTVFCPVNTAFKSEEFKVYVRDNLETFLKNHIVPSVKLNVDSLKKTHELDTMLPGQKVRVHHHFGHIVLNGDATVDVRHPVEAVNGMAYKIDRLLRPPKA
jgi:uncharacterized surface protein with fasciclin (FAS1) repeats